MSLSRFQFGQLVQKVQVRIACVDLAFAADCSKLNETKFNTYLDLFAQLFNASILLVRFQL